MKTVKTALLPLLVVVAAGAAAAAGGLRASLRQPEDRPLPPSPCPEVFSYEGETVDWDRWYGVILVATDIPLTGIRLDLWLTRPALALRHNWEGEVTTLDNRRFTILNLYKRVEPGPPESVRVVVKFDEREDIPLIKAIELNGRKICPIDRPKPHFQEDFDRRPYTTSSTKYNFEGTTRRTTTPFDDPYDDHKNTVSKRPPSNVADPYDSPHAEDGYHRPTQRPTQRTTHRDEYYETVSKRPAYVEEEPYEPPRRTTERDPYTKPRPAPLAPTRRPPDDSGEYRPSVGGGGGGGGGYHSEEERRTTRRPPAPPPKGGDYDSDEVPPARRPSPSSDEDTPRRPPSSSERRRPASSTGADTIRVTYTGETQPGAAAKPSGSRAPGAAAAGRKPTDPPLIDIRINPQPLNVGEADYDAEPARPPPGRGKDRSKGDDGPAHGVTPPGHGGTPPGHGGSPPGHGGNLPPGHVGSPPGHNKPSQGGGVWEQPEEDPYRTSTTYRPSTHRTSTTYRPPNNQRTTTTTHRPHSTTRRTTATRRPSHHSHGSGDSSQECGMVLSATPLVTYGQNTSRGQWPWHVALYQSKDRNLEYICGATLVSNNLVVTAAHCVTRLTNGRPVDPDSVLAYLGKYHLQVWTHEEGVQQSKVANIIVHPKYNNSDFFADVALLELLTPVEYSQYVRPVCLWGPRTELEDIVSLEGYVVGWGYDEYGQLTDDLRMATMPVVAQQTCLWSYPEFFSKFTSNMTFCAGFKNGTSVCNGDSGGGMVFPRLTADGARQWFLRGLVSTSVSREDRRVCNTKHYVVFTDLAKYQDWITEHKHRLTPRAK